MVYYIIAFIIIFLCITIFIICTQLKAKRLQQEQKIIENFQTQLSKIENELNVVCKDKVAKHNDILLEAENFCSQSDTPRFYAYKKKIEAIEQQIENIRFDYKKRDLQQEIDKYKEYIDTQQIDKAKKQEKIVERQIKTIDSSEQKRQFEYIKNEFVQQCKKHDLQQEIDKYKKYIDTKQIDNAKEQEKIVERQIRTIDSPEQKRQFEYKKNEFAQQCKKRDLQQEIDKYKKYIVTQQIDEAKEQEKIVEGKIKTIDTPELNEQFELIKNEFAQECKKRDLQQKRDLRQEINKYKEYIDSQQIDKAKEQEKIVERQIRTIDSPKQKKQFEYIKNEFAQQCKKRDLQQEINKYKKYIVTQQIDEAKEQEKIVEGKIKTIDTPELNEQFELIKNEFAQECKKRDLQPKRDLRQEINKYKEYIDSQQIDKAKEQEKIVERQIRTIDRPKQKKQFEYIKNEFAQQCKKLDLQQEINKYKKNIVTQQIDEAKKQEKIIERQIETINCLELKEQFEYIKNEFAQQYKKGIPIYGDEIYVRYEIPSGYINSEYYAIARFPIKNNIIWPFRRKRIALRGYKEESFELILKKYFSNQIEVLGDVNLLPQSGCRPYEPDIAIVDTTSGLNIRIDIEIDEPYDGYTHKPTHYIGCGDEYRDANINNLGWIVVRFTERQVHKEQKQCVAYIAKLLNKLNSNFDIPSELISISNPKSEKQWTQLDAQKMAKNNERENYLNHNFGYRETIEYTPDDGILTENEQEILSQVPQFIPPKIVSINNETIDSDYGISNNNKGYNKTNEFQRDREIHFDAEHHIYTYHGIQFKAVSNLISELFPLFDKFYWSERKADERGVSLDQILEEWDCKGARSREVGTFLHQQIENYFLRNTIEYDYQFTYNGEYVETDENISINNEFQYFLNFVNDYNLQAFRTEWHIFDKPTKLAGTIDFICRNGNVYDIYDWKRSEKVFKDNPFQSGLGELSHLQDTSYNHYCLQQNLYKYILEENYNIKIGKMYLVVLHLAYDNYIVKEVPTMPEYIDYILKVMND